MTETPDNATERLPRTVAIAGLGLLGGSLGLALRRRAPDVRVLAYARRSESIEQALQNGVIHRGDTKPEPILAEADCTVICMPISVTMDFVAGYAGAWKPGSVVTDVGSAKAAIMDACVEPLRHRGVQFVGSHPMAGKESAGQEYADADLYEGASVFVCCPESASAEPSARIESLWRAVGAHPVRIDPHRHDALVARTSHVLHLLSSVAARQFPDDPLAVHSTAGAFRDVTRIAASPPSMWTDIVCRNRAEVLAGLDELLKALTDIQTLVRDGRWQQLKAELLKGRDRRTQWERQRAPEQETDARG